MTPELTAALISAAVTLLGLIGAGFWQIIRYIDAVKRESREREALCEKDRQYLDKRLQFLESDQDSGFPEWRKDSDGRWTFVNSEFTRLYLMPIKKHFKDIQNRTNSEIDFFSEELKAAHDELDRLVAVNGYACMAGVSFHDKARPATLIKRLIAIKGSEDVFYRGIACPEFDNE